jgi:hypothetical protein
MAKNAVTDWSTNDSLNTDIGSTNTAEGCAPSGINDAIRKVMAQIATFIANITIGNTIINGTLAVNTPTVTVTDTQMPKVDLVRTSVATWHVGGSGSAGDNSFNVIINASTPGLSVSTGYTLTSPGAAAFVGGISSSSAIRATGTSTAGLNLSAGVELSYDGTNGLIQSYDRANSVYRPLLLYGTAISLLPQSGVLTIGAQTNQQGILTLGGAALGGISGQILFNTAAGISNIANISWQAGNDFRLTNTLNGTISQYVNGTQIASTSSTGLSVFGAVTARAAGATGSARVNGGDATHSGYFEFLDTANGSLGFIQQTIGGVITYQNTGATGHTFIGGAVNVPSLVCNAVAGLSATFTGNVLLSGATPTFTLNSGNATIWAPAGNTMCLGTSAAAYQNIRIDANGCVHLNAQRGSGILPASGALRVAAQALGGYSISTYDTTDYKALQFVRDVAGTPVEEGRIDVSTTGVVLVTSSDKTRKENFRDFDSGALVDALQFGAFEWTENGATGYGVLAQDAHEVFPQAISPSETPGGWGATYASFVPIAMAELKKLRARVAELEAREAP